MDGTDDQSTEVEVENSDASPSEGNAELDALFDGPAEESDDSDESGQETDDDEEIEHEGEKFRVPKKLKDAFLRQADYTKKTQEAAEIRRQAEDQQTRLQQEQTRFQETVQRQQQNIQAYANVAAMDQRLQAYQQVNWQQLNAENPQEAQRLWFDFQQIKDSRGQLVNQISQHEQQMSLQSQQLSAQRLEQARARVASEIKDWSPQRAQELQAFVRKSGFTEAEIAGINDHRTVLVLEKARKYDQMVANAAKKQAPAAPPAQPLRVVKSGSGSSTNPDNMNMNQWAEYERKRLAKKRS